MTFAEHIQRVRALKQQFGLLFAEENVGSAIVPGWFSIVRQACVAIEGAIDRARDGDVRITRIKEKMGGLRVSTNIRVPPFDFSGPIGGIAPSITNPCVHFRALRVRHRNLGIIAEDVCRFLDQPGDTKILAVIGATGAGKSTLVNRFVRRAIWRRQLSRDPDPSSIPFIFLAAPANGDRSISWTSLYTNVLRGGSEIFVDKKQLNIISGDSFTVGPKRHKTLAALRDALESMLIRRKVSVLAIDEAYHLMRFGDYSAVMDTIKSIADNTGTKLILVGSYDLFDLVSDYGQVARRAEIFHFRRYNKDDPADVAEFTRIVRKFQEHWPCEEIPNFVTISGELMEASLGCVGLLAEILLQALILHLEHKGKWNSRFMTRAAKSMKLLGRIAREIADGEKKIEGATYGETMFSGVMLDSIISKMNGGARHA